MILSFWVLVISLIAELATRIPVLGLSFAITVPPLPTVCWEQGPRPSARLKAMVQCSHCQLLLSHVFPQSSLSQLFGLSVFMQP